MPCPELRFSVIDKNPIRIDQLLQHVFPSLSRAYIHQLILNDVLRVNQKRVKKKSFMLRLRDELWVDSFVWPSERKIQAKDDARVAVLFENEDLFILNKPAGMPTHPNVYDDTRCLANVCVARWPFIYDVGEDALRPGIVHRLDTDTSGAIMVAKNNRTFNEIKNLFKARKIEKWYLALVLGNIQEPMEINIPVAHHKSNPKKMVALIKGDEAYRSQRREAVSWIFPLWHNQSYSLVRVKTGTGRMHQIRIHLQAKGFPLAGDHLYLSPAERMKDKSGMSHHFLHAYALGLDIFGTKVSVVAPLPENLVACLLRLHIPSPTFKSGIDLFFDQNG